MRFEEEGWISGRSFEKLAHFLVESPDQWAIPVFAGTSFEYNSDRPFKNGAADGERIMKASSRSLRFIGSITPLHECKSELAAIIVFAALRKYKIAAKPNCQGHPLRKNQRVT